MKNLLLTLISIALFTSLSCGSDGGGEPAVPEISVNFLTVTDADNRGNASDISVRFNPSENEEEVGEYRLIVAKTANANGLSTATASALAAGRYFSIAPAGAVIETALPATLVDSDGDAIAEGNTYQVAILTLPSANSQAEAHYFLSGTRLTLAKTDILETMVEMPIGTGGVAMTMMETSTVPTLAGRYRALRVIVFIRLPQPDRPVYLPVALWGLQAIPSGRMATCISPIFRVVPSVW